MCVVYGLYGRSAKICKGCMERCIVNPFHIKMHFLSFGSIKTNRYRGMSRQLQWSTRHHSCIAHIVQLITEVCNGLLSVSQPLREYTLQLLVSPDLTLVSSPKLLSRSLSAFADSILRVLLDSCTSSVRDVTSPWSASASISSSMMRLSTACNLCSFHPLELCKKICYLLLSLLCFLFSHISVSAGPPNVMRRSVRQWQTA